MKQVPIALAATLAAISLASAQTYLDSKGTVVPGVIPLAGCVAGGNCAGPVSATNPLPVSASLSGNSGTPTKASVSVATSSTTVLAASTATSFVKLCVALGAANGIWVRWDGGTATSAAPAEYIPPGQCDTWIKSTGFLPTSQINAIASATVAVAVALIYN